MQRNKNALAIDVCIVNILAVLILILKNAIVYYRISCLLFSRVMNEFPHETFPKKYKFMLK